MKYKILYVLGLLAICGLATSCTTRSFEADMKLICQAAAEGQVTSAPTAKAKKAAMVNFISSNIGTPEGRKFAGQLTKLPLEKQAAKLEEGMKTAGIEANACPTHAMIKKAAEAAEEE